MKIRFLMNETFESFIKENIDVHEAFIALANAQRGGPEIAMENAQRYASGPLSVVLEHVGDLTHRIAQWGLYENGSMGHEALAEKVPKLIGYLNSEYGFEKEIRENIRNNAKFHKIPYSEFLSTLEDKMLIYKHAHEELPVYNYLQWLCKMSAVYVGGWNFAMSSQFLRVLNRELQHIGRWVEKASSFKRDANGELLQYKDWNKE